MSESEDPVMVVVNEQSVHLSEMIRSLSVEGNWKLFERFARRQVIIQWADREGIELSPEDLQNEVDEWRYENRLERVEDTDAWLDQHGLTLFDVVVEAEFRLYERWLMSRIKEDDIRAFLFSVPWILSAWRCAGFLCQMRAWLKNCVCKSWKKARIFILWRGGIRKMGPRGLLAGILDGGAGAICHKGSRL